MRLDLRDGSWVELRDPKELTNGQRKPFMRAIAVANAEDADAVLRVSETACEVLITAWSFPFPIPSEKLESLDDLKALTYDEIVKACMTAMNTAVLSFEEESDPTEPSSA